MPDHGSRMETDEIVVAVLEVLRSTNREYTAVELEKGVADHLQRPVDTFDVRQAVWQLIADKLAILTENRTLRVAP